jgi:PAS domain S-box-containing protein
MKIPSFHNMKIRTKLISVTLFLVLLPLLAVAFLSMHQFGKALRSASEQDLDHLVRNIYSMCTIQQESVQKKVLINLNVAKEILYEKGRDTRLDYKQKLHFNAVNETTDEIVPVDVPQMRIGEIFPAKDTRVVDEVLRIAGGMCAIFQRTDDDQFLLVSTNILNKNGEKAVGTFITAENPIAESMLKGVPYEGDAYLVNDWYIAACEPVKDSNGRVIGGLWVGIKEQSSESLKSEIKSIQVGKTGYVYVINSKGVLKIHPAKEGVNIIDSRDSSGIEYIRTMIDAAITLSRGSVGTIRYPWINPELGETKPRQKIIKYTYFQPWDWIIAAGTYEDEIYQSLRETEQFILYLMIISISMVLVLTVIFGRLLAKPVLDLIQVTAKMAGGDLSQRVKVVTTDEIGILGRYFNYMIGQIQDYTSNLEMKVEERTKELKESREKFRMLFTFLNSILNSATEYAIIALDIHGNILEFNNGAEKIFGWQRDEVVSRQNISVTDTPEDCNKNIYKDIVSRIKKSGVYEQDIYRVRKDGSRFPSYTNITLIKDPTDGLAGFVEIVRDITQSKNLERELRETKDFLSNIMESSVDGIITTDLKGKITYENRGMEEMMGFKKEEVIGTHICNFYVEGIEQARKIMDLLRRQDRTENYEINVLRKDGEIRSIMTSLFILRDEEGHDIGTAGIFKDVSEQKLLEAKLKYAQSRLVEASKLRALGELVAGVAHEINNPLMASQTILHVILKNTPLDAHERERLELIRKCNDRIEKIVEHLREFSRETTFEFTNVDINVPIRNALMMTDQQLMNHNIKVIRNLSDDLPKISADASQLEQVFLNLISNARDAMEDKESDKSLTISSSFFEEDDIPYVQVSFRDTGVGIPEENLEKILEPFFSTKPVGKGTGLGLSLCFGIIESHGGRLDIQSKVGEGTEMKIILPVKRPGIERKES